MKKKLLTYILSCFMCFSICSCNEQKEDESSSSIQYLADQQYIYGMDYTSYEGVGNGIDYKKAYEVIHNMGVRSIRNWMHCTYFFDSKFNPFQESIDMMHDMISIMEGYDIQIIGMNHMNFNKYGSRNGKIRRDMSEGSYYREWLKNFEETYYILATTFPEIKIWEIDNETNNTAFMQNAAGGQFDLQEMTDISTDLFYYGSKGLHRANPEIQTVMGGFVTWNGEAFLEGVYKNIMSGEFGEGSTNPDDYFECLAWHPYTVNFNADSFVEDNNALYNISLKYEKKAKKVYLTEVGNWTSNQSADKAARFIKELYQTVIDRMPYVEAMHYYRCFDNIEDNNCIAGLFHDPNPQKIDNLYGTNTRANPGSPKKAAYAYQEMTGATGPLTLLEIALDSIEK